METVLGIDLGTTNSVISLIDNRQPRVLPDEDGNHVLPSAVGVDSEGQLLVGQAARNQAILSPDRTILSVKRRMGEDTRLPLGDQELTPQEVSAIILRALKERAAGHLGREVNKAVITVPAFFSENQRAATYEAGELAGLEVVRIINEPTAASLIYQPDTQGSEHLLVYDLGGGTFDVSVVRVEAGVVEVLSSHGDVKLGGDDFDRLLLDHVCDRFQREQQKVDLREIPTARSRLAQAVERAKCRLSDEAFTTIQEPFLVDRNSTPVNFEMTVDRSEYEELIEPLLQKTIQCVDAALADAKLHAKDIDKVVLVGGASRTPLVRRLLEEQLEKQPHAEVDPDLCVSLGAAMQGGLIAGADVDRVLVDITPHTLGVRVMGELNGMLSNRCFSPLIHRNTPLPATRSDLFYTTVKGQRCVNIDVYQGENQDVTLNEPVGSFSLEGLDESADEDNEILVRFELDLNGTLHVKAAERATSLERQLTIENSITQFRASGHEEAKLRLASLVGAESDDGQGAAFEEVPEPLRRRLDRSHELIAKANRLSPAAPSEDAAEIGQLVGQLQTAASEQSDEQMDQLSEKLDDLLFYLEDA